MTRVLSEWASAHLRGLDNSAEPGAVETDRSDDDASVGGVDAFDGLADGLVEALSWLWAEEGVKTLGEALTAWSRSVPPDHLSEIVSRALQADVAQLLGLPVALEESWRVLLDFDDRTLLILRERSFAEQRVTLDQLGAHLDVTRERVRQLESRALDRLRQRWLSNPVCAGLRHSVGAARRAIGPVATQAAVLAALESAVSESSDPGPVDPLRVGVLRFFLGSRVAIGDMSLNEVAANRLREANRFVEQLDCPASVADSWFEELISALQVPEHLTLEIERHLALRRIDGHLLRWRGAVNDKAVSVLSLRGDPMTMMELHETVGWEATPRSFANAVQGDPRVMRRGRDRYGLRSWGGEEYTGILDELEQAIDRSDDGRISLDEVIPFFVEEFGVSEGSVRSYAADPRFVRHSDGTLGLRTGSDPEVSYRHRRPEDTGALFRLGGIWHLRVAVDSDLRRGSGRPTRSGVALAAGLEPGLVLGFQYEGGTVTFSWRGRQPAIGSLRGVAAAHGCVDGDLLFVPLDGTEPRPSIVVRGSDLNRAGGERRLHLEMGLEADGYDGDPRAAASALGLPSGADWHDIVDRLRDRGDDQLIELIPQEWR